MRMNTKQFLVLVLAAVMVGGTFGVALADAPGHKVTICHASGLEGTTKFETLNIAWSAAYGQAGHFNENGTPRAGHEADYSGACTAEDDPPNPTETPTDVPPTETPTDSGDPTPTSTATPGDPEPSPTPTDVDEDPEPTPTDPPVEPTPTPEDDEPPPPTLIPNTGDLGNWYPDAAWQEPGLDNFWFVHNNGSTSFGAQLVNLHRGDLLEWGMGIYEVLGVLKVAPEDTWIWAIDGDPVLVTCVEWTGVPGVWKSRLVIILQEVRRDG